MSLPKTSISFKKAQKHPSWSNSFAYAENEINWWVQNPTHEDIIKLTIHFVETTIQTERQ
jgi:hypothetical protein